MSMDNLKENEYLCRQINSNLSITPVGVFRL